MEIILEGSFDSEQTCANLSTVLQLFKDRYHIESFSEVHLHVTLLDGQGEEVELINSETNETYRVFEVRQQFQPTSAPSHRSRVGDNGIHLVIDNTRRAPHSPGRKK